MHRDGKLVAPAESVRIRQHSDTEFLLNHKHCDILGSNLSYGFHVSSDQRI